MKSSGLKHGTHVSVLRNSKRVFRTVYRYYVRNGPLIHCSQGGGGGGEFADAWSSFYYKE